MDQAWVDDMVREVAAIKKHARQMEAKAREFPALACNLKRILASLRMMEINLGAGKPEGEAK